MLQFSSVHLNVLQTIITMFTKSKITKVFYIANDFCNFLYTDVKGYYKKYYLKKRRYIQGKNHTYSSSFFTSQKSLPKTLL